MKEAGGRGTVARPNRTVGWRIITSTSPSMLSRAMSAIRAARTPCWATSAERPLRSTPVMSTSRPESVTVTCRVGADLAPPRNGAATAARLGKAALMRGSGQGTVGQGDHPPRPAPLEAQHHLPVLVATGVQGDAATHARRGGDGGLHLGLDPFALQGLHHQIPLPRQIGGAGPVLQRRDPALGVGLRLDRNPVGAGLEDLDVLGAAVPDHRAHHLAGQRPRHEDSPAGGFGDPVALVAHAGDGQLFGHGALIARPAPKPKHERR